MIWSEPERPRVCTLPCLAVRCLPDVVRNILFVVRHSALQGTSASTNRANTLRTLMRPHKARYPS
jgi:hypothetical protein